jgi:hypothetical protein
VTSINKRPAHVGAGLSIRTFKENPNGSPLHLAKLLDRAQLCDRLGQLGLRLGVLELSGLTGQCLLGTALGVERRGLVEVARADRGIGQTVTTCGWTSSMPPET